MWMPKCWQRWARNPAWRSNDTTHYPEVDIGALGTNKVANVDHLTNCELYKHTKRHTRKRTDKYKPAHKSTRNTHTAHTHTGVG